MKAAELRDKSIQELEKLAAELAEQVRATKTAMRSNAYKRSHELGNLRRDLARTLTTLRQKRTITHS